jgi:hypothetical protein
MHRSVQEPSHAMIIILKCNDSAIQDALTGSAGNPIAGGGAAMACVMGGMGGALGSAT